MMFFGKNGLHKQRVFSQRQLLDDRLASHQQKSL